MRRSSHLAIVASGASGAAPMPLEQAIEHYLGRLLARGHRVNTIKAYRSDLVQFLAFVAWLDGGAPLVATLSQRHVARWLDRLNANGVQPRSISRKLTVLRGFVKHGRREGWLHHDPTADEQVRYRRKRVIAPELEQLHGMVDAIPTAKAADVRDRAMLRLALDSGLRISEIACLDLPGAGTQTALDLDRQLVHVVGKGGDVETVPFNARTASMLRAWLMARGDLATPGELALFVNAQGRRPSRTMLHQMIKRRGAAVGLEGLHFHLLRHRRISQLVAVVGTKVAQQFARHAHEATTGEYGRHADTVAVAIVRERADLDAGRKSA